METQRIATKKLPSRKRQSELWATAYRRARRVGRRTFEDAIELFERQHGFTPGRDLPLMPIEPIDLIRFVADVPVEKLHKSGRR
jgi:hypothetical protein